MGVVYDATQLTLDRIVPVIRKGSGGRKTVIPLFHFSSLTQEAFRAGDTGRFQLL